MKIIVTGGAGFIGSAIVWRLNELGHDDILIVDRADETDKWKNLAPLRFGAGLKGKVCDGWAGGTPCAATSIAAEGLCPAGEFGGRRNPIAIGGFMRQRSQEKVIIVIPFHAHRRQQRPFGCERCDVGCHDEKQATES